MAGMARLIGYGDQPRRDHRPRLSHLIGGFNGAAAAAPPSQRALAPDAARAASRSPSARRPCTGLAKRSCSPPRQGATRASSLATGGRRRTARRVRLRGNGRRAAIAAHDDDEFAALARAMNCPELAGDPRFATLSARTAHEDEFDGKIADWTSTWDKHAVAALLQAAGVHAAPVQNARDVHASAFLRERGLIQRVAHPAAGAHDYQGLPLHVSGVDLRIELAGAAFRRAQCPDPARTRLCRQGHRRRSGGRDLGPPAMTPSRTDGARRSHRRLRRGPLLARGPRGGIADRTRDRVLDAISTAVAGRRADPFVAAMLWR